MPSTLGFFEIAFSRSLACCAESPLPSSKMTRTFSRDASFSASARNIVMNGSDALDKLTRMVFCGSCCAWQGAVSAPSDSIANTIGLSKVFIGSPPSLYPLLFAAVTGFRVSIEGDSQDNDHPDNDLLVVGRHIDHDESVQQYAEQHRSDDCASDAAETTEQAGSADDHGRDDAQLIGSSCDRFRRAQPRRQEEPAETRQEPDDDIDADQDLIHIDAGQARRLPIAAYGVNLPSVPGISGHDISRRGDDKKNQHRHRNGKHLAAPPPTKACVKPADRPAAAEN